MTVDDALAALLQRSKFHLFVKARIRELSEQLRVGGLTEKLSGRVKTGCSGPRRLGNLTRL